MSHRFKLDKEKSMDQIQWIKNNVPQGFFYFPGNNYVDIITDEDAEMFVLTFGIKRHSTKIERMIKRERELERVLELRLNVTLPS